MGVLLSQDNSTPLLGQNGTQLLDQAAGLVLPSSLYPIQVTVEILINGTWTDISHFVYQRDVITIGGGQPDEGSPSQPATANLTLNNRDGRFSPLNASGAYFPFLQRNIQLRISATATSTTGNYYSGYRFWGEVAKWPPLSDPTATDIYVKITATGPLRRVNQGGGKGSALTRYYSLLSGVYAPIAYFPAEEDPDTDVVGAGIDGGTNMTITTGTPVWKAVSSFNGSAPIGVLNNSTWDGLTGSFGSSGDDVFLVPGTYQWQASTATVNAKVWGASGGGGWGGGGANGFAAGGGGEFAQEATLAVTIGNFYTVVVGAGGGANIPPGAGGTGYLGSVHHDGGAGGTGTAGTFGGGGGGGSSAGTGASGNPGANGSGQAGGAGGAAPAGGAAGGKGGNFVVPDTSASDGSPGGAPGGGGGGSAANGFAGGSGEPGKVELVYTPSTVPSNNVIRFILYVPPHGGNNGAVLVRALTGGTIARLDCLYVAGGKIQVKGYDIASSLLFTSSNLTVGDGVTLMVSMELVNSGASVAYTLSAIKPGATALLGSVTGTQAAASIGNVSEIIAAPNADITKTAMGHFSVQYALIPLVQVSKALDGYTSEMSVDRFLRLAAEQALDTRPQFSETADHWGFELGHYVAMWTPANAGLTRSTAWSSDGQSSALLTATGEGQPSVTSPSGTSGQPVSVGDIVSIAAELQAPASLSNVYIGVRWYQAGGAACAHAEDDTADAVLATGTSATYTLKATAPATAAFFAVTFGNHHADAAGTLLYCDNFRVSPRMGAQTRKEYKAFLDEIRDLEQGILEEAKDTFGLKYRTRIRLINQVAVTLDYTAAHLSGDLAPVIDDQTTRNHVVVHRHKGSKVTKVNPGGPMIPAEPPAGIGRYKKTLRVLAETDAQLVALAAHLLNLGIVSGERYPQIMVQPARAEVAAIMSALAGIDIGDRVQIINLPFWYPSATADQLVIGYTEVLGPYQWDIVWNCQPASPWTVSAVNLRRW